MEDDQRKTLVLTGASRGIGHATVKRFSSAGWRVITCSRHAFPEDCPWEAGPEDHMQIDLSDIKALPQQVEVLRAKLNGAGLNALVNNAAISPKEPSGNRLDSMSTEMNDWRHVFQVNFFAPIMLARGLFKELTKMHGTVVNVTSIAGGRVHPFAGTAYATSKAALASLTREIKTSILAPETEKNLVPEIPMRRLGTPEEVAKTIYFLCSEQSSYVNGAEIHINGGQHA